MSDNVSLLDYLLPSILQYVLNLYLFYETDIPKLENIIPFKFDIKPHLRIEKVHIPKHIYIDYNPYSELFHIQITYIDDIINIKQEWYLGTIFENLSNERTYTNYYKKGILEERHTHLYDEGDICFYDVVDDNSFPTKSKVYFYDKEKKLYLVRTHIISLVSKEVYNPHNIEKIIKIDENFKDEKKHGTTKYNLNDFEIRTEHWEYGIMKNEKNHLIMYSKISESKIINIKKEVDTAEWRE
jgi:hypothetical protein